MKDTLNPEEVIRTYLMSLEDPSLLVDTATVSELEKEVADASDPIDKLRALAALSRARVPDIESVRQGFVRHARTWAEKNDIPLATFAELGVSRDVLKSAGLAGKTPENPSPRPKAVTAKDIERALVRTEGVFTLADVGRDIGGSPMTVRKAVEHLVKSGQLIKLGVDPQWTGPGRAPLQFRKS